MGGNRRGLTVVKVLLIVGAVVLGFLLVVGTLIALLLPALHRAREQARATMCAANLRQSGQLTMLFSATNDGRAPGGAIEHDGKPVDWEEILNRQIVGAAGSGGPGISRLSCPDFIPSSKYAGRPYGFNKDAAGGFEAGHPYGPYAQPVSPAEKVDPRYGPPDGQYWLGAKIADFEPNEFLIIEQESPNPLAGGGGGNAAGQVSLGGDATYPVYSTPGGAYSFRHPYSKEANFLFFDNHVAMLRPTDDVASPRRYAMPVPPPSK